jgi:hypothetical protein
MTIHQLGIRFRKITLPPPGSATHKWATVGGTLRQNSNGTTVVSANNDPVGFFGDTVGTAHLIQATSGNRPLYQTPSIGLSFDGSNDRLAYAGTLGDTDGSVTILFKTGSTALLTEGDQVLFSSADEGTANNWFEIGITGLGQLYIESNAGGTKHTVLGSSFMTTSTDYYAIVVFDGTDYFAWLNGVEQNPLVVTNEGTRAWFGDVTGADNLVAGGTVTSGGLVRPFNGIIREIATYSDDISV